ncbi:MAG: 16S rRNA (guanine(966)-N(2))-methyltransferase RsmD [Peptococcaceae bacterium]|nr:16S rRNA (guanine(966)-N(2))-methyltransferase RsmD [Peptococcaceae bacterium]
MVRIIAGHNRGRKLKSVPGMKTRPTADRVKEAVFSSIDGLLYGCRFLDVFGGTGSISLEAVSRGAEEAVILEKDADALKVIQENITACGQQQRCRVMRGDSLSSLNALGHQGKQFNLIYVDPPYQSGLYETVLQKIASENLLAKDGMILLECAKNTSLSVENSIFFIYKEKNYGDTRVVYVKYKDIEEDTP